MATIGRGASVSYWNRDMEGVHGYTHSEILLART